MHEPESKPEPKNPFKQLIDFIWVIQIVLLVVIGALWLTGFW